MARGSDSGETPNGVGHGGTKMLEYQRPGDEAEFKKHRMQFGFFALIFQAVMLFIYFSFAEYNLTPENPRPAVAADGNPIDSNGTSAFINKYYTFYQHVHVMIFVGIGFLIIFPKRYAFSSVGYNFMLGAVCVQWALPINGWIAPSSPGEGGSFKIGIEQLIDADVAAAVVLISFCGVLGKTTPTQMLIVCILEIVFWRYNMYISLSVFGAVDDAGSMLVHVFAAYFGLALSFVLCRVKNKPKTGDVANSFFESNYNSDLFAMLGTCFLWVYWPSFNASFAKDQSQEMVIINTVIALAAGNTSAFICDSLFRPDNKFDMVTAQNATLAAGVTVGSIAQLMINPWGAIVAGCLGGFISTIGYIFIQPFLEEKFGLHDACGINNLHGMTGIIAGIGSALCAMFIDESKYNDLVPSPYGEGSPLGSQALAQIATLVGTIMFSIGTGLVTGFVVSLPIFRPPNPYKNKKDRPYTFDEEYWCDDEYYWFVPEVFTEENYRTEHKKVFNNLMKTSPDFNRAHTKNVALEGNATSIELGSRLLSA